MTRPWLSHGLAVLAIALGPGCAVSSSFGGIWRGESLPAGPQNGLVHGKDGAPVGVELVLGEYGPDLAGVVRFYRNGTHVRMRSAAAPDLECACVLVRDGRASPAAAAFTLRGCLPGGSTSTPVRVRGSLTPTAQGAQLDLQVDDPGQPLDGLATTIPMRRERLLGEVSSADLACPPPTAGGNPASGT